MALVVKDRVKETTSTTGTGTLTLGGAVTGFQTFTSVLSNSDTTYYAIFESSTGQFEVGLGTFTSSGTTLARTTILESSNSGNAINLTAGAADVFITQPAEKAVYLDASGHIDTADGRNVTNVAASTAATLATARDIGGVSFNGSASINLPGVNTSGNQDTSGNAATATTAGTVTTAAQTNITSLGTLTTLTVDDITINGSTISDAGDLTIDSGGDIVLDADGADVRFRDAGTEHLKIFQSSGDVVIASQISDKDMKFNGTDGGSGITALTLDMSAAGAATFNSSVTATALTVDEITINADTITATDDFIIDAAADIKLDANGGYINFFDDGTAILTFQNSSTDAVIWSRASDRDMIFKGNDGGSVITGLTLDFSDAGSAYFNHDVKVPDNGFFVAGAGSDLRLSSDGTNGTIDTQNGNLNLDVAGEIYLDADSGIIRIRDNGGDIGMLRNESNDLTVRSMVGDADLLFKGNDGGSVITALTLDMSAAGAATFNAGITTGGALELSNNNITGINDIYLASEIYHTGDTDTKIGFGTNEIEFQAGGVSTYINTQGVFIRDGSLAEDYDALSGTSPTCDVDNGGAFSITTSGNTTFTFTGASSGYSQGFVLQVTAGGTHTLTWPGTVDWAGGSAPDAPASGASNLYVFYTRDGGSNWIGVLSAAAYA